MKITLDRLFNLRLGLTYDVVKWQSCLGRDCKFCEDQAVAASQHSDDTVLSDNGEPCPTYKSPGFLRRRFPE